MRQERRFRSTWQATRIFSLLVVLICTVFLTSQSYAVDTTLPTPGFGDGPLYVPFNPIFVSVIIGDQTTRQVGVTLTVQLVNDHDKKKVEAKRSQLHSAFFQELYSFFQMRAALRGVIDQPYLKRRLLKTADRVVGQNIIKAVLIEQLFVQPR